MNPTLTDQNYKELLKIGFLLNLMKLKSSFGSFKFLELNSKVKNNFSEKAKIIWKNFKCDKNILDASCNHLELINHLN
jgi:hypothetical protein